MKFFPTVVVVSSLAFLGAPPTAGADPGGSPVCDPDPPAPGFEPVVAPCPAMGRTPEGDLVPLPGLPYCPEGAYILLTDIAAVGGESWYCINGSNWPDQLRETLPYCPAPLALVPDAAALGGQRWQCPVAVGSGPVPPTPPIGDWMLDDVTRLDTPPAAVGSGPAPPSHDPSAEVGSGPAPRDAG